MNVKPGFQWIAISKDMSLLVLARRLTSNTKKTKKDKELKYKYLHPDHVKKTAICYYYLRPRKYHHSNN